MTVREAIRQAFREQNGSAIVAIVNLVSRRSGVQFTHSDTVAFCASCLDREVDRDFMIEVDELLYLADLAAGRHYARESL